MDSLQNSNHSHKKPRRFLRFSLRTWLVVLTWFVVLTLICLGILYGKHLSQRNELQRLIIRDGSIVYRGVEKHDQPEFMMDSSIGPVRGIPSPTVEMRDSFVPWISRWSKGSAMFCRYDSIEYYVGNVPMPNWVNEVLATGELRRISLRVNNPEIDLNLVTENEGLEELELMGSAHDPHTLQGIHRLKKLKKLNIYGLKLSYEQVMPQGLPPNLVSVYMPNCDLQSSDLAIFYNCGMLESLTLRNGPFNLQALAECGLPTTLKKADFYGSRIVKADLVLLAACPKLMELNLGNSDADLRELDMKHLPDSLVHLDLSNATLDASTFRWLSQLDDLESLKLDYCKFDDADAEGIVLRKPLKHFTANKTNAGIHVEKMRSNTFDSADAGDAEKIEK